MLGTKLYKGQYTNKEYADLACWCNANNATIEDKGDCFEVVAIPEPPLEELKTAKLQEVNAWTASKITGGFISNASGEPVRYDSDVDTQTTMQGIALNVNSERFATNYPNGCPVRGYAEGETEKTVHYLTAEGVLTFCADLSEHIGKCKLDGWTMQNAVNEASTKEELEAIVW